MKTIRKYAILVALLAVVSIAAPLLPALAAPPAFPALGSSVFPLTFQITGATTATKTNAVNFIAPFNMRILYATAVAGAKSGAHVTGNGRTGVVIKNDGNTVTQGTTLAGKFIGLAVALPAAGTATETNTSSALGTPLAATAQNVTVNKALSADLVLWGASPSVTDVTLVIWAQRRG